MYTTGDYIIKVSKKIGKKYDVYDADSGRYLLSFGDIASYHYYDKIGHFKYLDTHDKRIQYSFVSRHTGDRINYPNFAVYWELNYLYAD